MDIVIGHDLSIITELYYGFLLHFYKVLLLYAFKTFNFFFHVWSTVHFTDYCGIIIIHGGQFSRIA